MTTLRDIRAMLPRARELSAHPTRDELALVWGYAPNRYGELEARPWPAAPEKPAGPDGLVDSVDTVDAYVNESRWVADCVECGGGMAVDVAVELAACLDCGTVYTVVVPDAATIAAAEKVLGHRRPNERHWRPNGETVADLKAENAVRGVNFA